MTRFRIAPALLAAAVLLLVGRVEAQTAGVTTTPGASPFVAGAMPTAPAAASEASPATDRLSPAAAPPALLPGSSLPSVDGGASVPVPAAPVPQVRDRSGIPFMVAGAALFVSGAIVGDRGGTILMVGGAGIGAYGLFVFYGGEPE